jgi:hypothetical protein
MSLPAQSGGDGEKRRFGIGKDDITYRLVQIGIMRNRPEALYRDLEKGRARAFVDLLANLAIDSPTGGWAELRALDARISGLVRSIEAGAGTGGGASPSLDGLMAQRADLLRRIRVERPELAETRAVPEPDPARLQAALADGEAMLYFLPARQEDALRVLLITRQAMTLQTLPTTAQALRAEIAELARAVELKVELTQQAPGGPALTGAGCRALARLPPDPRGTQRHRPLGAVGHPRP